MKKFAFLAALILSLAATMRVAAETVTVDFNSLTDLPDGWTCVGGTVSGYDSTPYTIAKDKKHGADGKALYSCYSSTMSAFVVTPELTGEVSFWYANYGTSKGSFTIYEAVADGDSYMLGDQIFQKTYAKDTYRRNPVWEEGTIDVGAAGKRLAILLVYACLDDFTYTPFVAGVEKKELKVTGFQPEETELQANQQHQFTASFNASVKNNGNIDLAANEVSISLLNDAGEVLATTIAETDLPVGEEVTLPLTCVGATDEDATFTYRVKENLNDAVFTETATVSVKAYGARFALTDIEGGEAMRAGTVVDFGYVTESSEKTFYITNSGNITLNVTDIQVPEGYTVSSKTLSVETGATATLTVTLDATQGFGYKSGELSLTLNALTARSFRLALRGVVRDPNALFVTFDDGQLPDGWSAEGSMKFYSDGNGGNALCVGNIPTTVITQKITGQQLVMQARRYYSDTAPTLTVSRSTSKEGPWTEIASFGGNDIMTTSFVTLSVNGISDNSNEEYYIKFDLTNVDVDNLTGIYASQNDPRLTLFADEELTVAANESDTYNFGLQRQDATVTYYISNQGTGILTINNVTATAGFTAATAANAVLGGQKTALTVTMPYSAGHYGLNEGYVTVKTNAGTFTLSVMGVVMDPTVAFVDFREESIPAGWVANNWTSKKGADGYASSGAYASDLVTTSVEVMEGQPIILTANGTYTAFEQGYITVKYSIDGENWTEAESFTGVLKSTDTWYTLVVRNIPAGTLQLAFEGAYAYIQSIYGFHHPDNQPLMAVLDAEGNAVTNETTDDFGLVSEPATHVYTVRNAGTGTLVVSIATDSDDFNVTLSSPSKLEGVRGSISTATLSLEEGASADVEVQIVVNSSNYGPKNAILSFTAEGQETVTVNLTGRTMASGTFVVDFENGQLPAGWYAGGRWNVTAQGDNHYANQSGTEEADLITPRLIVSKRDEPIEFQIKKAYAYSNDQSLEVSYSLDRKNWIPVSTITAPESTLFYEGTRVFRAPLPGRYYLKFTGINIAIDNIIGWQLDTSVERDLYLTDNMAVTPTEQDGFTVQASVANLIGEQTVKATLYVDGNAEQTEDQTLSQGETFTPAFSFSIPSGAQEVPVNIVFSIDDTNTRVATSTVNLSSSIATDIQDLRVSGNTAIYDLQGRRISISRNPLPGNSKSGIYIIRQNGVNRKAVMK